MRVFCIFGDSRVFRSKSPAMFSAVMRRAGIKGAYVPFMVAPDHIEQALQSLRVLNMAGATVTVPYKEVSIPYLDELSEGARIIGAVNTIVCSGGILKGYNTNAIGFMDAMNRAGVEIAGRSFLVFGVGGMAKAVVFILNWLRAKTVTVAGRNKDKVQDMVRRFGGKGRLLDELKQGSIETDLVINATSVSGSDESLELSELVENLDLRGCKLVLDLNYGRKRNFWKDLADTKSIPFMDGLSVLAYQAMRSFALWTKIDLPPEEFIRALSENGHAEPT